MDRLLLETDAPYLPPQSKRGQFPNEPANIVETYAFVAKEKKVSPDVLREKIMENASSLFIL
jgi:TatD DNase family protein